MGLANFDEELRFPSCNFYFKKRMGKPAQFKKTLQFGIARQTVGTGLWSSFAPKELGVMEKLA
jgi:hypothetical protein